MSTQYQRPETESGIPTAPVPTLAADGSSEPTRSLPTASSSSSAATRPVTASMGAHPDPATGGRAASEPDPFAGLGAAEGADLPARRRHVVDRFDGAIGLLLLRLAAAAVIGVKGLQKVADRSATEDMLRAVRLPAPEVLGLLFGPVQIAIAVALVLGLAVRAAGFGIALSAITALVLVNWATGSVLFTAHVAGFNGDSQLLLAGIGLMFLGVGGGGLGLDRRVRNRGKAPA